MVDAASLPEPASRPELVTAIEPLVRAAVNTETPGIAVAAFQDGSLVYRAGHGMANLEWQQPVTTDTVFRLGSLTKQFTAALTLLLERDGVLQLDDPLITYVPDYPDPGGIIRLWHLLTHTSGIPNYTSIDGFFATLSRRDMTLSELVAIFKNLPLDFAPGTAFSYCNSGYILLGAVIEAVYATNYANAVQQRLFAPLGMQHARYLSDEPLVPHRASGYTPMDTGYCNAGFLSMTLPHAAGALGASIDDLVRWEAALQTQQLMDRELQARMATPVQMRDGTTAPYGFGWMVETINNQQILSHNGGINGFRSYYLRVPAARAAVMVLGNSVGFDADRLGWHIAQALVDLS